MSTVPAKVLWSAREGLWEAWSPHLAPALEAVGAELVREADPDDVRFLVAGATGPVTDFAPYRNASVLSIWAGVEEFVANPTLTQPLARMIDPGLTAGMVEYVTGHVLRHHLGMDAHVVNPDHAWAPSAPPLASARRVGILGMGALGKACADALGGLGFDVTGWARGPKDDPRVRHGADGLADVLGRSEILVLLLPHTPATEGIMNAARLALLPKGAVLLNPGRGALVDEAALLDALDGHLAHATLDTFRTEPLPGGHPFWAHPRVTVTPHIASATRPETASSALAENVRRGLAGAPLIGLVDRGRGY